MARKNEHVKNLNWQKLKIDYDKNMSEIGVEQLEESSFDSQFEKREVHTTDRGTFESVHIKPENPVGSPVIYCLGWTGEITGCKPFYEDFYYNDKEVYSVQYPTFEAAPVPEDSIAPAYVERNAEAVMQMINDDGIEGGSFGGAF